MKMHEMARYDILEVLGHGEKEKSKANINQSSEFTDNQWTKNKENQSLTPSIT